VFFYIPFLVGLFGVLGRCPSYCAGRRIWLSWRGEGVSIRQQGVGMLIHIAHLYRAGMTILFRNFLISLLI
jgi:hypothetical protein